MAAIPSDLQGRVPAQFGGIAYPRRAGVLALHAAVGKDLILFEVDRESLSLRETRRLSLAAPVQYVWPHPTRNLLYVACSNRPISKADDLHVLATVAVDDDTGAMRVLSEVALPTRPIHLTLDALAQNILVVYNAPPLVTSHSLDAEGRAGAALVHAKKPWPGYFPHQILMLPSGEAAVIVARGNHATTGRAEEPGSLEILSVDHGLLHHLATVAPAGGVGFGPRHLAFHPSGRWAAVSVERQNELHIFAVERGRFSAEPVCRVSTLAQSATGSHDQLCSTLHFHPSGAFLYVANRHDTSVYGDGTIPSELKGNSIAVFAFDAEQGRAELLQQAPTHSIHVRTFSLDASGRLLVAASILPALARGDDGVVTRIPARLSFYHVADNGHLSLARIHDMDNERVSLFWSHLNGSAVSTSP